MNIKNYPKCIICGRRLRNDKTIAIGYGPTCYKKLKLGLKPKYKNKEFFTKNEK